MDEQCEADRLRSFEGNLEVQLINWFVHRTYVSDTDKVTNETISHQTR